MKIKPYLVKLADCYILGPCISFEMGEVRTGLSLLFFEVGLGWESQKVYSFGCSGCSAIGYARLDELPPGWEKRYRLDQTYYFLCDKCRGKVEPEQDYLVTDENRGQAVDELVSQLAGDDLVEAEALRGYANKLLDESEHWAKSDLANAVSSYSDGLSDAREKFEQ